MKTRFCPSPTGDIHIGNVRTALFNVLLAKANQGGFLLRIEDTDTSRSLEKYVDSLCEDLKWLGFDWDEGIDVGGELGPYKQSQREDIYNKYHKVLLQEHKAYYCFCTEDELKESRKSQLAKGLPPKYRGKCRNLSEEETSKKIEQGEIPVIRFKVPVNKTVEFVDLVKGGQSFRTNDIGDFIIQKTDRTSSFFFANAVDDSLMGVTHALRGEDHLTNTPRQILLLQALGLDIPQYGHISIILGKDGQPLSKRNGSVSIKELREQGYLPSAIVNYLARLGHYYKGTDFMSDAKLAQEFMVKRLVKSAALFEMTQLDMWQKKAIKASSMNELEALISEKHLKLIPNDKKQAFFDIMRENILFPKEIELWASILFSEISYEEDVLKHIQQYDPNICINLLSMISKGETVIKDIVQSLKNELNLNNKPIYHSIRLAFTGRDDGPELQKIYDLIPKELLIKRLEKVVSG